MNETKFIPYNHEFNNSWEMAEDFLGEGCLGIGETKDAEILLYAWHGRAAILDKLRK